MRSCRNQSLTSYINVHIIFSSAQKPPQGTVPFMLDAIYLIFSQTDRNNTTKSLDGFILIKIGQNQCQIASMGIFFTLSRRSALSQTLIQ